MSEEMDNTGKELNMLKLFEEGKNFTEQLMKENEKLRLKIGELKNDIREMEGKYIKVDVPKLQERSNILEEENQSLKKEIQELKNQYSAIEEENWEFAERYVEVERQNSNLINMYVASYRLHSTLEYDLVIKIVKEIVINMIGSEDFRIYIFDESEQQLVRIAYESENPGPEVLKLSDDETIAESVRTGQPYLAEAGTEMDSQGGKPVAVIPMKVSDKVMGAVVIGSLLIQKDGFQPVDFELFEMLGGHAATAIYGSQLYTLSERKRNTLENFIDMLKKDFPKDD